MRLDLARSRVPTALLAGVAVAVSALPVTTLVRRSDWYAASLLVVAVVALAGVVGRVLRLHGAVVVLLQVLAAELAVVLRLGLGDGPFGLPTPDLLRTLPGLATEGVETIRRYAAPAPATPGLTLLLVVLVAAVAVLADALAVGRRQPAAAGFPLLVLFLVAAVNTPGSLPWGYFAGLATAWLLLVAADTARTVRHFATVTTQSGAVGSRPDEDAADRFAWRSRAVALVAVVVAVLAQVLLPHTETRFVTEGLGRSSSQPGGGGSVTGFRSDVDVSRDLAKQDSTPVLTYRTDGVSLPPLAVATATRFEDGHWVVGPQDAAGAPLVAGRDTPPSAEVEGPTTPSRRRTLTVIQSAIAAPQLATPGWPLRVSAGERARVSRTPEGLLHTDTDLRDYSVTYSEITPTPADLGRTAAGPLPVDDVTRAAAGPWEPLVKRTLAAVLADPRYAAGRAGTPYRTAVAIQEYLRSEDFMYSLTLARTPTGPDGAPLDPVSAFLTTKRGYCVQFSTAMAIMARTAGIPARVRLGFLPGTPDLSGRATVTRRDAHMWPELYLPGTGWTRFEPTPGGRAGLPPAYAQVDHPTPKPSRTDREPSAAPTPSSAAPAPAAPDSSGSGFSLPVPSRGTVISVLGLLLLGLLGSVVPVAGRLAQGRRRDRATTAADIVEADWSTLRERLGDLGVDLREDHTLRDLRAEVQRDSSLPGRSRELLAATIGAVEQARYGRPGGATAVAERAVPVDEIVRATTEGRAWPTRLRALLWPSAGVAAVRSLLRR